MARVRAARVAPATRVRVVFFADALRLARVAVVVEFVFIVEAA